MTMLSASPAWRQDRDGKRVYLKGGQAWARDAPRNERGHFVGRKPLDPVLAAARQRQREAAAAIKEQTKDQRTRISRRIKTIERDLRARLRKQGTAVSIDLDLIVGQVAQAAVRLEAFRGQLNRGLEVDDEQMSRLSNLVHRGLGRLGLRPTMFDDGERQPRGWVSKERWGTTMKATPDDDRTRTD